MNARAALYLCGPTAVGKSAVALELAARLNGEIISVDSMQVYRGMDIGTAKPSPADRDRIPHHLIDVADLTENFDAAKFVARAKHAEAEILARGKRPIYCGGTGLYFNALLHGLGAAPAGDPVLRAELEQTPAQTLLDELKARDPIAWEQIDKKNPRRVIRAVEVIRLTGRKFSEQRAEWPASNATAPLIGLDMVRDDLRARIDARVERMFAEGLIDETRALLGHGLRQNRTASQALGYKQVIVHLDGKATLRQTIDEVKLRTRQFAKRQHTWFRHKLPIQWLTIGKQETPGAATERMLRQNFAEGIS